MSDLLAQAREHAERADPAVRAAALLRIARVQAASDPGQARATFVQGLEEIRRLAAPDAEFLQEQARLLAAAVAPDLVASIPAGHHAPPFTAETIGKIMLQHEHGDAAFDYVMDCDDAKFPFPVVAQLIEWFGDKDRQLALFRRAVEAWRASRDERFLWLFQIQWKTLPPEEAITVVREIVRVTLERRDQPITATYEAEGTVRFTSVRQNDLFRILHVLRHLDPPLAESLIAIHTQLATAARRFPNGLESIQQEADEQRKNAGESCGGGFAIGGSPRDFPYLRTLLQASEDGEFDAPIEHALERYRDDTAPDRPNYAPREFWPSTCSFRSILYRAGKKLGPGAAAYLDRIPDPDLRLFAQIELAAALAGLPELQGVQRKQRSPSADLRRHRLRL